MPAPLRLTSFGLLVVAAAVAGQAQAQETATWYIPTYSRDVLVWDEASEQVVDRIRMTHPIPNEMTLNEGRDRLYVLEATGQVMEIVDLRSRSVVDTFTLSRGNVTVRIDGLAVHPSDERAILIAKRYTKGRDRYTVEGPFVLEYDLRAKEVTDTLDWPDGLERDRGANFRYSPDGEKLYFFADDVIALDAESYEELDRWEISQPLEPGLGRPRFSMNPGTYDEPGVATGLFRMTDPIQNRSMLGIATVRLADEDLDFYTLGESEPMRGFALAPDGTRAYALYSEIGRYEFWAFDLENRSLASRHPFAGRPRMGIQVSADGGKLYVYVAGNTIDVYDASSFELLRTVEFDEDMTLGNVVVIPGAAAP
jgi:DNA-binding beta-propeller fold protein YncE